MRNQQQPEARRTLCDFHFQIMDEMIEDERFLILGRIA